MAYHNLSEIFTLKDINEITEILDEEVLGDDNIRLPKTFEEFLKMEGLREWPSPTSLSGPLDIHGEGMLLGNAEDILKVLQDSAPLGMHVLENLEKRLDKIDNTLHLYADFLVNYEKRPGRVTDRLFRSPSWAFLTELPADETTKSDKVSLTNEMIGTMLETRKKCLDYCSFPGFEGSELMELPGQLEAPQILNRVTKAQNFSPGFKFFWKKLFLSEASVAFMQDFFWWIFLDKFYKEKDLSKEKSLLFDRIADSFVALFTSIHLDVKDKFLMVYPGCLAQAVYTAYITAFPESLAKFDNAFKQDLINLTHEWIAGVKPLPGTWKKWNISKLMPVESSGAKERSKAAKKMLEAAALNKEVNVSLDIDSFVRSVERLGDSGTSLQGVGAQEALRIALSASSTRSASQSEAIQSQEPESHPVGSGPKLVRVKFNTSGRSPLIAHYLHMHQLRDFAQPGMKVRRTEVDSLPLPGPTYKQLIKKSRKLSTLLSNEYCRFLCSSRKIYRRHPSRVPIENYAEICEQTNLAIAELKKRQRQMNGEIDEIQRELAATRNPQELRVIVKKIEGLKERDKVGQGLAHDSQDHDSDVDLEDEGN